MTHAATSTGTGSARHPVVVALMVEGDTPGGTERLVIQLALELRRRGHSVVTVGPAQGQGWLGEELKALGFQWETIPRRHMLDPRSVFDILRLLRRYRVDAVHSHEFAPSVFGAAAAWLTGRTHVITMHSNPYFATSWRRRQAFRWAVRHSTAVAAVSRDTGAYAAKALMLPNSAIHVIPNGIAAAPGKREPLRRDLGLSAEDQLVVALGNLSDRKAHIVLLQAMALFAARRPDVRWHVAVAGQDRGEKEKLLQFARDNNIAERVHLLGLRSDTEDILAAGDVFAMSSLHEGMPLAIMEAMFAGRAVVSSQAGGIGEMIKDGVDGLLTPVGDAESMSRALERVLTDSTFRDRLAKAGRERADRQFSIGAMMDAYLRLYSGETGRQ